RKDVIVDDQVPVSKRSVTGELDGIVAGFHNPVRACRAYSHPVRSFQIETMTGLPCQHVQRHVAIEAFRALHAELAAFDADTLHDGPHHVGLAGGIVDETAPDAVILD